MAARLDTITDSGVPDPESRLHEQLSAVAPTLQSQTGLASEEYCETPSEGEAS